MYDRLTRPPPQLLNRVRPRSIRPELHYFNRELGKCAYFLREFTRPLSGCWFDKRRRLWQECCHEVGMKVYRTIILNQVDTFCFWVVVANLCVKRMQCDDCAGFHLLVNDIPRVGIQRTDAIASFLRPMTLTCQGVLRAGLCPVFCHRRLEIETKLILINHDTSFWVFTGNLC